MHSSPGKALSAGHGPHGNLLGGAAFDTPWTDTTDIAATARASTTDKDFRN